MSGMLRTAPLHCAEHNLVSTDPLQYVVIAECALNEYPEYVQCILLAGCGENTPRVLRCAGTRPVRGSSSDKCQKFYE